jgi:hypothetical protein
MSSSVHGGIQQSGTSGSFSYSVKSGMGDKAVNYVSFWDAARFCNWLATGDTEVGVYNLGGVTNPTNSTITRDAAIWAAGGVAIASEDEWYKAAYYKGGSTNAGYWDYAHQSDLITVVDANYDNSVGTLSDVGAYSDDASYYGTYDQGGNVWEWNDTMPNSSARGVRGGSYTRDETRLKSSSGSNDVPDAEYAGFGFRIASLGGAADIDSDGLSNVDEVNTHFTDPNDFDSDDDGLSDGDEVNLHSTDPNDSDSDDDGILDGIEVKYQSYGFDPTSDSAIALAQFQEAASDLPGVLTDEQRGKLSLGGVALTPAGENTLSLDFVVEVSDDLEGWTPVDTLGYSVDTTDGKMFMRVRQP